MVIMKICIIVHWNLQWSDAFLKQLLMKNLGTQKASKLKPSSWPFEAHEDAIAHMPGSAFTPPMNPLQEVLRCPWCDAYVIAVQSTKFNLLFMQIINYSCIQLAVCHDTLMTW